MVARSPWAFGAALALLVGSFVAACGGSQFTGAPSTTDAGTIDAPGPVEACRAKLCPQLRWACGSGDDGCGQNLDCGACIEANTICDAANHKCICRGKTCAERGFNCGSIDDGCGNTLLCGSCTGSDFCGGAGDHKCGTTLCTPKACAPGECGTRSDGCGGTLDCGQCTAPASCGGGGTPNKCNCTSKTCAELGWDCGQAQDNCGQPIDCGGCDGGTCANHSCVACVPTQTCALLGYKCGSFVDDCGQVQTCGDTPAPLPTGVLAVCTVAGGSPYACTTGCGANGAGCSELPGPTPPEPTWGCKASPANKSIWCCTSTM